MTGEAYELILRSAQDYGVLPLTSKCNVACLFCSNHQNPPQVRTYNIGTLSLEQIDEIVSYMSGQNKIVIGESATRINEGEPFTHPHILPILHKLRQRFPSTLIQITTNGSLLTDAQIRQLAELEPLEMYLSLNSASAHRRSLLMRDPLACQAIRVPELLHKHNVTYHGSLVALPVTLGFEDMNKTIAILAENGAKTIRVFMPGYTRWHQGEVQDSISREVLASYARTMTERFGVPVLSEPPVLNDLQAVLAGVISGSPAAFIGLQAGDVIERVDGIRVWSRNHAFSLCRDRPSPQIEWRRGEQAFSECISKEDKASSGIVLYDDMNLQRMMTLQDQLNKYTGRRIWVLTSVLAAAMVTSACQMLRNQHHDMAIIPAPSEFFGGTIEAAGLLTVRDIIHEATRRSIRSEDVIVLPQEPFDHHGMDLTGESYRSINDTIGCAVVLA